MYGKVACKMLVELSPGGGVTERGLRYRIVFLTTVDDDDFEDDAVSSLSSLLESSALRRLSLESKAVFSAREIWRCYYNHYTCVFFISIQCVIKDFDKLILLKFAYVSLVLGYCPSCLKK